LGISSVSGSEPCSDWDRILTLIITVPTTDGLVVVADKRVSSPYGSKDTADKIRKPGPHCVFVSAGYPIFSESTTISGKALMDIPGMLDQRLTAICKKGTPALQHPGELAAAMQHNINIRKVPFSNDTIPRTVCTSYVFDFHERLRGQAMYFSACAGMVSVHSSSMNVDARPFPWMILGEEQTDIFRGVGKYAKLQQNELFRRMRTRDKLDANEALELAFEFVRTVFSVSHRVSQWVDAILLEERGWKEISADSNVFVRRPKAR
jgi:hypothetical protein